MQSSSYVYIYLNPLKPGKFHYDGVPVSFLFEPFYVGKGCKDRMYKHIKNNFNSSKKSITIKCIEDSGYKQKDYIIKLVTGLSDMEAFAIESSLIYMIGRANKKEGPLLNLASRGGGVRTKYKINDRMVNIILKSYEEGTCIIDIAKEVGVSSTSIYLLLKEHNIIVRGSYKELSNKLKDNVLIIKNMLANGTSVANIAKEFNTSRQTIYNILKR